MKKNLLISALVLCTTIAFGQIQFAPEIGLNMFSQKQKYDVMGLNGTESGKILPGARIGVAMDIPIGTHFAVQPGLFYSLNRTEFEDYLINGVNITHTIHAIQLPAYFLYQSGESGEGRFFAGIGPYLSYAVAGKIKTDVPLIGASDQDMEFGDDNDDDQHAFDIGGSVTIGYELPMGLYFRGGYNLGFANLQPQGDNDNSLKNRSFAISVGYFLGR